MRAITNSGGCRVGGLTVAGRWCLSLACPLIVHVTPAIVQRLIAFGGHSAAIALTAVLTRGSSSLSAWVSEEGKKMPWTETGFPMRSSNSFGFIARRWLKRLPKKCANELKLKPQGLGDAIKPEILSAITACTRLVTKTIHEFA